MKNIKIISFLLTLSVFALPVYAGEGHAHDKEGGHSNHGHSHGPIDAAKAKKRATRTMKSLAKRGVINKSWASTAAVTAEKKKFTKGEEWVVSFKNDKIKDTTKQTLYIFYSLDGRYIAANYTGK